MRTPRGSGWILVRKAGLEPASLAALAPKASVFAISPLPQRWERTSGRPVLIKCRSRLVLWQYRGAPLVSATAGMFDDGSLRP